MLRTPAKGNRIHQRARFALKKERSLPDENALRWYAPMACKRVKSFLFKIVLASPVAVPRMFCRAFCIISPTGLYLCSTIKVWEIVMYIFNPYVRDLGNFYVNKNPYERDLGNFYVNKTPT